MCFCPPITYESDHATGKRVHETHIPICNAISAYGKYEPGKANNAKESLHSALQL